MIAGLLLVLIGAVSMGAGLAWVHGLSVYVGIVIVAGGAWVCLDDYERGK